MSSIFRNVITWRVRVRGQGLRLGLGLVRGLEGDEGEGFLVSG